MITFENFRISRLIYCFMKRYPRDVAHSLAFLVAISKRESDLSGFELNNGYVKYVEYVEDSYDCKGIDLDVDPGIVKSTSTKMWNYLTGNKVEFDDKEKELLRKLGIDNG